MGSLEEKISILEIHNELIDRGEEHYASDFPCMGCTECLLNERIDFFTDLLFLITLTLVSKILIVDRLERDLRDHRRKGRECVRIHAENRCRRLRLRGTLVLTSSLVLVVSNSWASLGLSGASLY